MKKTNTLKSSHHQHKTEKQGKDPEVDIPYISGRGMYKECGNKQRLVEFVKSK